MAIYADRAEEGAPSLRSRQNKRNTVYSGQKRVAFFWEGFQVNGNNQ